VRADLNSQGGGRLQAIAFRAAETDLGRFLFENRGATVHVAGSLASSTWNGMRSVQFRIVDAAKTEP
ncbi:MAG TPA: single-stranded-DNA-specific exonuclease RecJ, partial [Rhizobiaceae bacterium]|nr:single-stranded-DNA-specific exonuclease RecJ [Rhizobiaceae bacterium]